MGIFVVLEGLDASGKTAVSKMIEKKLSKWKVYSIVKREYFEISEDIYYENDYIMNFQKKLNELAWKQDADKLLCYMPVNTLGFIHAAWYEMFYLKYILDAKTRYDVILVDGWWYKTFARIMVTSDYHYKCVIALAPFLPCGDVTIFLDVEPEIAWNRRKGEFNKFERGLQNDVLGYEMEISSPFRQFVSFQKKTKKNILKILPKDFIQIETSHKDINQVTDVIVNKINQVL